MFESLLGFSSPAESYQGCYARMVPLATPFGKQKIIRYSCYSPRCSKLLRRRAAPWVPPDRSVLFVKPIRTVGCVPHSPRGFWTGSPPRCVHHSSALKRLIRTRQFGTHSINSRRTRESCDGRLSVAGSRCKQATTGSPATNQDLCQAPLDHHAPNTWNGVTLPCLTAR